jgi:hypothetical protein
VNQVIQVSGALWSPAFMLITIVGVVLLVIVLIKLMHVAVFALFHPHVLGVLAGVAALFLLLVGLVSVRVGHQQVQQAAVQNAVLINGQNLQNAARDRAAMLAGANAAVHAENNVYAENADDDSTKLAEAAPAEKTAATHSDATGSPPAWTVLREHRQGDTWLYVVHLSHADTALPERDGMLDAQMSLAAQQCVEDHLYPGENISKIVRLDPEYLRANFIKQTYPVDDNMIAGQDFYAQLKFDKDFRDEVERRYRQIVSWDHLQQLGNLGVVAMAVLGGLYIYLRTTASKKAANSKLEAETATT